MIFILIIYSGLAIANQIAFTIDDAPRGDEYIYSGAARTEKFIEVLKKHNIQTVFFSNSNKINNKSKSARLEAYGKAGHFIANHTHSHPRLSDTPIENFVLDIDMADEQLSTIPNFVKWFRYPFLNEGKTKEKRDAIRNHLKSTGYRNGYVTVDNYDYYINDLVQTALAKKEKVNLKRACSMLIDLMWDGMQYYDGIAKKYIGTVRHVLLMHENDIEAYCLEDLITHIQSKGWEIISPAKAFEDPLLKNEPDTLYLSQGRVAAIVHAKTGIEYKSKWESTSALDKEFKRRLIVEK